MFPGRCTGDGSEGESPELVPLSVRAIERRAPVELDHRPGDPRLIAAEACPATDGHRELHDGVASRAGIGWGEGDRLGRGGGGNHREDCSQEEGAKSHARPPSGTLRIHGGIAVVLV